MSGVERHPSLDERFEAQRISDKRRYEGAGAEHATRHWESSRGGGGV